MCFLQKFSERKGEGMKNKGLLIGMVGVVAIIVLAFVFRPAFTGKTMKSDKVVNKSAPATKAVNAAKTAKPQEPAKKTFSKGMGGITVKAKYSNGKPQILRTKIFRSEDKDSSIFVTGFTSDRMQELLPGTYDIEVETIPAKICKNINVSENKETIYDLGSATGAVIIKALNSKKKEISLPARISNPKNNLTVTAITANRPVEVLPGVYNIDIDTMPRQTRRDVRIEKGRETVIDLGVVSGSMIVKAVDENGKEARVAVNVKDSKTNMIVTSTGSNRASEIAPGEYDIDILTTPVQTKKGVRIIAGEEVVVDFLVKSKPVPQAAVGAVRKK